MPDAAAVIDAAERWCDAMSDAIAAASRTDAALLRAKAACDAIIAEINAMRAERGLGPVGDEP